MVEHLKTEYFFTFNYVNIAGKKETMMFSSKDFYLYTESDLLHFSHITEHYYIRIDFESKRIVKYYSDRSISENWFEQIGVLE